MSLKQKEKRVMDTKKQVALKNEHIQISSYRAFAEEDIASAIAGDMILFNKGLFTRGEGKRPVPADTLFIANLDEGYRGWVRWFNGKPVDYRIGRIVDGCQFGSSWGARRGLQQLYGRFDRERRGPGLWPVVKLETEHRQNKRFGVIPEPRFNIVGWCTWEEKPQLKAIAKRGVEITDDDPRTAVAQAISDEIPFAPEWRA
jgi:hypothetical protein